jgi:hypothetical protein
MAPRGGPWWQRAVGVVDALRMKPVAPALRPDGVPSELPSLQSEIRRLCDDKAAAERTTIPAPPSVEVLRAATPYPPPVDASEAAERQRQAEVDTIPAPAPASSARSVEGDDDPDATQPPERVPSTIPGPPRLPRIA